jgi:MATE family multidrug resistance protein
VQKYFVEARQLLALAIPVILAQVAQTAMGFVDTVMAGGYSATDMAAVAIGTSIWLPAILFGHGLLLALTPVAQLNGSGRRSVSPAGASGLLAGRLCLGADHGRAVERRLHHQLHA